MIKEEKILSNWNQHLSYIETYLSDPRKTKVLEMVKALEQQMVLAPASGKSHFHNAFPGGYIDHVNRVVEASMYTLQLWKKMGADIDFTDEELVFSALFHDLGKIGDLGTECYLPQKDNWRRDKLNEQFTINSELPFMLIQDRSLYLLQKFGIELSHNEYMAVRLHDGVYDDANKAYFFSNYPDSKFRTNIVYILHQADRIAARVEYEKWRDSSSDKPVATSKKVKGKTVKSSEGLMNLVKNI